MSIDASIFIRARNEEQYIGQCIERILEQDSPARTEILVLDSESSDKTAEIAQKLGARVFTMPARLFSYSGALNAGLELCKGEFFVSLSAHAIPVDANWLTPLLEAFAGDQSLACSYSRQIAWPDASPGECVAIQQEFSDMPHRIDLKVFKEQLQEQKHYYRLLQSSNASACYRRSIARSLRFRDLPFSEDRAFVLDCLLAGYSLSYVPESCVYHSHYPQVDEFFQVARKATFAQLALRKVLGKSLPGNYPAPCPSFAKTLAIIPYACFHAASPLFRSIFARTEARNVLYRQAAFALASIGTTFGKNAGYRDFSRQDDDSFLSIAQYAHIIDSLECS